MKQTHEFFPSDRYKYDLGLCSIRNGFAQIDTEQDASYYGNWANPEKLIIFTYCEGDCYTVECDNLEEFVAELEKMKKWNEENGWKFYGIDPGLNKGQIKKWENIGLKHLLH